MSEPTWADCYRIARRLARLAGWSGKASDIFPLATWAEIIASELGIEVPEGRGRPGGHSMSYPHWPKDPQPRPKRRRVTSDDVQDWLFLVLLLAFIYLSMFAWGGPEL